MNFLNNPDVNKQNTQQLQQQKYLQTEIKNFFIASLFCSGAFSLHEKNAQRGLS